MPRHAGRRAAPHFSGRLRSADLPAPDLAGIFHRKGRRTNRDRLSSRAEASCVVRQRKANSTRGWHRRTDSVGFEPAPHPAAHQSSKKVAALEGFGIEIVEQVPVELQEVKAGKN